jgi:hypothetical protein
MSDIPQLIFIIPYRNRKTHLNCFLQMARFLLDELSRDIKYEIVVAEQSDTREFNRGAMKNLGFMYIKSKYPRDYKNMTFVFNDVDIFPGVKGILPNYIIDDVKTVKHFYGFDFALGGVFSIKGSVFERVNGFPNFWGWGFEDNCLQKRLVKHNYNIDRSKFYNFNDENWINLFHGFKRKLDENIVFKFNNDNHFKNGISTIKCDFSTNISCKPLDETISAYIVSFYKWSIPENVEQVNFEINDNPTRIFQKKKTNKIHNLLNFK